MRTIGQQLQKLKLKSYADYLLSTHWKLLKRRFKTSDKIKCPGCRCRYRLDLHHVSYKRLGEELPTDIIGLCRDCHYKIHQKLSEKYESERLEVQVEKTCEVFQEVTGTHWNSAVAMWMQHLGIPLESKKSKRKSKIGTIGKCTSHIPLVVVITPKQVCKPSPLRDRVLKVQAQDTAKRIA